MHQNAGGRFYASNEVCSRSLARRQGIGGLSVRNEKEQKQGQTSYPEPRRTHAKSGHWQGSRACPTFLRLCDGGWGSLPTRGNQLL